MEYTFFYASAAAIIILLSICVFLKKPGLPSILIGFVTIGYSLTSDVLFGDRFKLFYYITPDKSTLFMILGAFLIYAPLNIIYTMFLPSKSKKVFIYTGIWIAAMLLFEYLSLITKTIVFTGWKPIPWSPTVYIATYLWVYFSYRYLNKKIQAKT